MARELKGYAAKKRQGLVPHHYDRTRLKGVWPPVSWTEARHYERLARYRDAQRRGVVE